MSIVTKLTDSLVKLQGSVDSSNAHQFEEELLAAISGQPLTLDAEELAYISSAGLRVVLGTRKAMGDGKFSVRNLCSDVREIFDITGFSDIITIE